jgi:hypothetical protein
LGGSWFPSQTEQKVQETPSQPVKAGHGCECLSSQLCGKHRQEDCYLGQPR